MLRFASVPRAVLFYDIGTLRKAGASIVRWGANNGACQEAKDQDLLHFQSRGSLDGY